MPKFLFRFQSMMNINEKLKDQKEIEFGKAVQALEVEKQKLSEIENNLNESISGLKESMSNRILPRTVYEYNSYIEKLKKDIQIQMKNIVSCEQNVETIRKELSQALMEIKKFEKLKEKDFEIYNEEIKQKENAVVDEIVTYKYTKKEE